MQNLSLICSLDVLHYLRRRRIAKYYRWRSPRTLLQD